VANLTSDEAQQVIEKRLADGGFVNNPHVTVFVDEYASQTVTLLGEVVRPGTYPIVGERRLYDFFSAAGGLTDKAGRTVTLTHRDKPQQPSTIRLPDNLADNTDANVPISAGDTIVVSRAGLVYVVGDVSRPSGILIEDNKLTVLKALALAGGTTKTSSLNGSKLLRQTPAGVHEISVPLKKILRAQAPDEPMVKGDILFVPTSGSKAVAYRGTEAIMALTTALTIVALQ
jgi:polysaccharide export outer membrane protein